MNERAIKVIDRLGGLTATARLCEITKGAVWQWKEAGVPKAQEKFLRVVRPDVFEGLDEATQRSS